MGGLFGFMVKMSLQSKIRSRKKPHGLAVAMLLLGVVVLACLAAACSDQTLPLKPEAKVLRDFLDGRLENLLSQLGPRLANGHFNELDGLLCGLPKGDPDLPHLILVLNEKEKVLATRTFNGPNGSLKMKHPIGYNYSNYELINGRTAGKETFLFCMYYNEGKLLVACRSAWDGIRYAGTVCVAVPRWGLPQDCRVNERQFIDLDFDK